MISFNKLLFIILCTINLNANNFQNIKSFEAKFTQTIKNPSGTKVFYNGTIHIKEPYLVLWQYKKPIEKLVYIKKYTITIIEPELEQAIVTKLDKEINILELLKNATLISENTYLSKFNNVEYTVTLKNDILNSISYKDELENSVNINFKDVRQNHKIDEEIFKFVIPYEYDLIKK
ncbi:MAG: LolA-like outer membrane lipoprotein chaperone [Arcobacteraceae bacterium]